MVNIDYSLYIENTLSLFAAIDPHPLALAGRKSKKFFKCIYQ